MNIPMNDARDPEQWDPDFAKRKKMKESLDQLIPEFSVRLGGTTSIDVTKPGIDKAYGIRKLREPEPNNPHEVEGVINPAAVRGPDGHVGPLRTRRSWASGNPRSRKAKECVARWDRSDESIVPPNADQFRETSRVWKASTQIK